GLGGTVNEIKRFLTNAKYFTKNTFSCCGISDFLSAIENSKRKIVVIAGIEAHVCVLQTAIDLMDRGFLPVIIYNCVSSRKEREKEIAIKRICSEGGIISTVESILFELLKSAEHPCFKEISKLIK
ncbi:MAG: isochorismatase family protein, partial [Chitinispirillaceae bacterium]|nr:isochorismatase family protein [Chitinispirillaceae bacterium]